MTVANSFDNSNGSHSTTDPKQQQRLQQSFRRQLVWRRIFLRRLRKPLCLGHNLPCVQTLHAPLAAWVKSFTSAPCLKANRVTCFFQWADGVFGGNLSLPAADDDGQHGAPLGQAQE